MTGPVTRVYWRHYSKYYDTHDTIREAAYAVKYGDGNGFCSTEAVYDKYGDLALGKSSSQLGWAKKVLKE